MKNWVFVVIIGAITAVIGVYTTIMGPLGPFGPWYLEWPHPPYQPVWAAIGILVLLLGLWLRSKES